MEANATAMPAEGTVETAQESKRVRGTGSVYRRGDNYWIKYYQNGRAHRESAKTTDPDRAAKFLTFRLRQIANNTFIGLKAERITVEKLPVAMLDVALAAPNFVPPPVTSPNDTACSGLTWPVTRGVPSRMRMPRARLEATT